MRLEYELVNANRVCMPRHPNGQSKSCHQECSCHSTDIMHMQGKPYAEERQPPVVFWWIRSWWYGIYQTQVCVRRSLWYSHSMLLATTIFMSCTKVGALLERDPIMVDVQHEYHEVHDHSCANEDWWQHQVENLHKHSELQALVL